MIRNIFAFVLILAVCPGRLSAQPPLEDFVSNVVSFYNRSSKLTLPSLSGEQLKKLGNGKTVHLVQRDPLPGAVDPRETVDRVIGMRLMGRPRTALWIAALDPDAPISGIFHDYRLEYDGQGGSRWCVYLDLPWPLADRMWVADLSKNIDMARAADGYFWEHRWDLTPGGRELLREVVADGKLDDITLDAVDDAIYLPVNRGGLIAVPYDEETTLIIYHLSTVVGGFIPDAMVRLFSREQIDSFLDAIERSSAGIYEHYTPTHERVYSGAGDPIESLIE